MEKDINKMPKYEAIINGHLTHISQPRKRHDILVTHNTGTILSGDHMVVRITIILLRNVNTSVSEANVG